MPDAGRRVVFQGVTYAVKSRTGDTLECYPLGCADKTTGEVTLSVPQRMLFVPDTVFLAAR